MKFELKVRRGKGGSVSSPTTTAGYVAQVLFILALSVLINWALLDHAGVTGRLLSLAMSVFMLSRATRDAIAWFQATGLEREEFRREVESASLTPFRPGPLPTEGTGSLVLPLAATVMFGFMGNIFWAHARPLIVLPVLGWLYVIIRVVTQKRREQP
jgi:hypothetical protein